jgi:hypothetical protein
MYLLDTNIFRGLAASDFPPEATEIDRRLRSGVALPFFTCEVVIDEILVKLADDPVNRFHEVRSSFSWMERICGNSRVAPSATNVIRRAIHNNPELDADDEIPRLNQVRREIVKAKSFSELRPQLQDGIRDFGPYLREKLNKWVAAKDELCRRARSMAESTSRKASERELVEQILGIHLQSMLSVGTKAAMREDQTRNPDQISEDLREYSHLEALIMTKALLHKRFNFAKHRNDYHDQMLCAYPAVGYVLVTRDRGIRENLALAGCPNPRLTDLASALSDTEGKAENKTFC